MGLSEYRLGRREINSKIYVRQPTLGEIEEYGEQKYFGLVRALCATPADRKVEIWDALHVYWDTVDGYKLFISAFSGLKDTDMSMIFGELDTKTFRISMDGTMQDMALVNADGVVIDKAIYALITDSLRDMHKIRKNEDIGFDKYTKDAMIEDERDENEKAARKPFESILLPLVSSLTNCADFKYRWDDVWDLPVGVFLDSAARITKHENFTSLIRGIYSGNVDVKKISKKELNWMGSL